MKENADLISRYCDGVADDAQTGAVPLYRHLKHQLKNRDARMHFVGHSAGAIVSATMIARMVADGMKIESCTFMAPALCVDEFDRLVEPPIEGGKFGRYQQFLLTDRAEEDDPNCGRYRRSPPRTKLRWAPGRTSTAATHGGFDDDEATMHQVLRFIRDA